jgi:hypothetical protein
MSKNSGNGMAGIIAVCFVIAVVYLSGLSGQCSRSGCTNQKASGSRYCYTHSYKSSTYSTSRKTAGSYTSSRKNSSSSSKTYSDPYDVQDYDDPEDFYYDNYDDFDGYEDAEDYWDENHE